MYTFRLKYKKLWLCIIPVLCYILLQILQPSNSKATVTKPKVTFLNTGLNSSEHTARYHTNRKCVLKIEETSEYYTDFNASLCFKSGTDLKSMQQAKSPQWKCDCLVGWHGNDCSQPEVIWRALLSYRRPVSLKARKHQRRIVAAFEVDELSAMMAEIRVNELNSSVDLFILYENNSGDYLKRKLDSNFLIDHHNKIVYVKAFSVAAIKRLVVVKDDDIVLCLGRNEVPNSLALHFLKLYNNWPKSVRFRYRYSVYGFFWLHPDKTIVGQGLRTVSNLYDAFKPGKAGELIIGDLNHFGGWYCELCLDPPQIVKFLKASSFVLKTESVIDVSYVEDLIENGLHVDGITQLQRTHRFQERYFAPTYVTNCSWKYDSLLINLYTKLDY